MSQINNAGSAGWPFETDLAYGDESSLWLIGTRRMGPGGIDTAYTVLGFSRKNRKLDDNQKLLIVRFDNGATGEYLLSQALKDEQILSK